LVVVNVVAKTRWAPWDGMASKPGVDVYVPVMIICPSSSCIRFQQHASVRASLIDPCFVH
jgi:hypothetical protein